MFFQVNYVHPGLVMSDMQKNMHPLLNKLANLFNFVRPLLQQTGEQGTYTVIFAATSPSLAGLGGNYLARCEIEPIDNKSINDSVGVKLWKISSELVGLKSTEDSWNAPQK